MAIGKIITGQTFGNWLNTTNLLIDEVNQATDTFSQGKLVRWGAGGTITVSALTSTTLQLSSGNAVNAISNNWATPVDDMTLMTSNAIHHAIINGDTIRLVNPTRVTSNVVSNTISVVTENNTVISISNTATHFYNDVTFHKDLTVLGTKTELNVVTMEVEDSNIQLNVGSAASKFTANNAGFDVGWTNAFMRLINTGTEFPEIIPADLRLNNMYKMLEIDVYLTTSYTSKGAVNMNEKDRLEITYSKPSQATIDTSYGPFYNANDFVVGIGTQTDTIPVPYPPHPFTHPAYHRESTALNPASYNGEIIYDIAGTQYPTYAAYKAAFAAAPAGSQVKITIDPNHFGPLYYWIGEVQKTVYANTEVQFMKDTSGRSFTKIDFPLGFPIEENPTLELYTGDEIKFEINLQSNLNANAFYIGTTPYTDLNRLHPTTVEMGGNHTLTSTTYEVDGTPHGVTVPSGPADFAAYEADFQTGSWANVTFIPSQPGTYYYWATGNSADPLFQMGGQINVYPRHLNMGGQITIEYPMGKTVIKNVTYDAVAQEFELDNILSDDVYLEAGDTVTFNITNPNHNANVFVISSTSVAGSEFDYALDNVLYTSDANAEYRTWAGYAATFNSNTYSNVTFTPFAAGTYYYYANNNPSSNGKIIVSGTRPYDLGAYHLSTDNSTATIENPLKFVVTQNKFPIMELDGDLAKFDGTKNGILLPSNSFDYNPPANGIIRYNDVLHMFEGYTQGQWRGLGGIVDLNQDTYIEADDINDTLYFVANGSNVSQMRNTDMFLDVERHTVDNPVPTTTIIKDSHIRVEANANNLNYSVYVEGTSNSNVSGAYTIESGRTGILIDQRGVKIDSSGYLQLPYGDENDRPYNAANGMVRMAEDGLRIIDANGAFDTFDVLELYAEGKWNPLSYVTNEYVNSIAVATSTVPFRNLYVPFRKEEIDVYVNGIKILKSDYKIVNTPNNVWNVTATYDPITQTYSYLPFLPPVLDKGDKLTVSYTITDNTAPLLLGIDDPANPGNPLPSANVVYDINSIIQPTVNAYRSAFLSSNTAHSNTANIVYTANTDGTYHMFAENSNAVVLSTTTFFATGRTSWTSELDFSPYPRLPGQVITVNHKPGRDIGVVTINAVSRSELLNGYGSDVRIAGQVTLGSYQSSTSTTTGALVVRGGLGMSGDLFVGRSVTELSAGELKTNITGIDSALDKVIAMKGVEFNWKEDNTNTMKEYGLIAEDVAKIAPNLVSYQNEKPQGVKYSKVVALLIEAMKQQQNEIELLKSQLPKKRGRKPNNSQG